MVSKWVLRLEAWGFNWCVCLSFGCWIQLGLFVCLGNLWHETRHYGLDWRKSTSTWTTDRIDGLGSKRQERFLDKRNVLDSATGTCGKCQTAKDEQRDIHKEATAVHPSIKIRWTKGEKRKKERGRVGVTVMVLGAARGPSLKDITLQWQKRLWKKGARLEWQRGGRMVCGNFLDT